MTDSIARASAPGCAVSGIGLSAALAQDAEGIALDPIVVVGDRTTTLAYVTVGGVAIVTEEQAARPTVSSYRNVFRGIVNLQEGDFTESGFVIRGLNSEGQTSGIRAPLATFEGDGAQQTFEGVRRGLGGVFDVEQVEVYRGPRSTLSDRAAMAGAIYLRTNDPEFERSGGAQVTYGEDSGRQVGLAYGDHRNEFLAFRVSGEWGAKDNDFRYSSCAGHRRYDEITAAAHWSGRSKILLRPTGDDATRRLLGYARSFEPTPDDIAGPDLSSAGVSYDDRRGEVWGTIRPDIYPLPEAPAFQDVRETRVDNLGFEATHELTPDLTMTTTAAARGAGSSAAMRRVRRRTRSATRSTEPASSGRTSTPPKAPT